MADVYVRVSNEPVAKTDCHSNSTLNVDLDYYGVPVGVEALGALEVRVEGMVCRCAPTPSAAPTQTEDALVSAVAEGLRDFKFEVGPNTLEKLRVGLAVYLTPEERHRLAHAAVNACRRVVRDDP